MNSLSTSNSGNTYASTASLLPLFVGSGCAALIYEIVWFQSLQLIVGASAISLGVLLTTFMGGMFLGSFLFPLLVPRAWHPLRVYACLETGIAVFALLILYFLPDVADWYISSLIQQEGQTGWMNSSQASVFMRATVAGVCLLPPTILMGATLPAISRWYESDSAGAFHTGLFYSANIGGAVLGCLATSFYLLRLYDMQIATWTAIAINLLVSLLAVVVSWNLPYAKSEHSSHDPHAKPGHAYLAATGIALSGFAALGAEVVWTRELSLLLGASVYTFSIILSVFLLALGIGSRIGSAWARDTKRPFVSFALCQAGAALGIAWASIMMARSLPYWPIDVSLSNSPWLTFQLDIVRVAWAVFPAALCWGLSFPLALTAAAHEQDPARMVGFTYAANTLGAIFGALGVSCMAIPWLGIQATQQVLVLTMCLSCVLMLWVHWWRVLPSGANRQSRILGTMTSIALLILVGWLVGFLPRPPVELAGYGRYLVTWLDTAPTFLYSADGLNASIAVSEFEDDSRNFHVSGKVVASSEPRDMRLQRMLGHLPGLLCDEPRSVLIVGCGAGVTAGSFVVHPTIERIVICEIEPLIPQAAGKFFSEYNHKVIQDERLEIIHDDARHFLLTTDEQFDIITSDPIHPWVKGAAALYSKEYFELTRRHLKPGGIATQWVPLYESSMEAVQSEIATFFSVFPEGTLWTNDDTTGGYDLVMLGQEQPTQFDLDHIQARIDNKDSAALRASLDEVGLGSAYQLAKTYGGNRKDLEPWYASAMLNSDLNLRLQYSAGWSLNEYSEKEIRASMLPYLRFPNDLFVGPPRALQKLRSAFATSKKDANL